MAVEWKYASNREKWGESWKTSEMGEHFEVIHKSLEWQKNLEEDAYCSQNKNNLEQFKSLTEEWTQTYESREQSQDDEGQLQLHRRARKYLESHRGLSDEEYHKLFDGKKELQQWQLGDCYVVSGILELANTDYFDELMSSSIKSVTFRDGSYWYAVRMPLGEPHWRDILIKKSELALAKIKGGDWFKLLELAYIKNRRPNNHDWNRYTPVSEWEFQKINQWGNTREVLQKFLWRNNISFNTYWDADMRANNQKLSVLSSTKIQEITNFLKNYNPQVGNKFVELDTPRSDLWDSACFNVWGNVVYYSHAYALDRVVKDSQGNIQSIKIKNPWNDPYKTWWVELSLNLSQFLNTFSYMEIWTIKADTFMDEQNDVVAADYWDEYEYLDVA